MQLMKRMLMGDTVRRRIGLILCLLLIIVWLQLLLCLFPIASQFPTIVSATGADLRASRLEELKYHILFWTSFYGDEFVPSLRLYHEAVTSLEYCPFSNCGVSSNRSRLLSSDAVIFHIRDMDWSDLPKYRLHRQYYLFYGLESPVHTFVSLNAVKGFFNLTFTYRLDSDVVTDSYFQHFHPNISSDGNDIDELVQSKTKFAVAFMSNCHMVPSRRDVYLENLQQFISVDVYGKCGTLQCSTETPEKCYKLIAKYKFYLAFENSICKDYVTEKIHQALNQGTVPIVYGGADYAAIFPPKSFVDVMEFQSPRRLAEYLFSLDGNEQEYKKYLEWRTKPFAAQLQKDLQPDNLSWCKICTILNTRKPETKIVLDLQHWWSEKGWCRIPETARVAGRTQWIKNPSLPKR